MSFKALNVAMLRVYVTRAMQTGTLADAAIAADYMAKATRKPYEACMNALCKRYNLRFADRACKDRPGMYTAKDCARELAAGCVVKFDKETISEETIKVSPQIPAWILA